MEKINPQPFWNNLGRAQSDYQCPLCRDTGWRTTAQGVVPCSCRREAALAKRKAASGLTPALIAKNFANFKLQYYPDYLTLDNGVSYQVAAEKALAAARRFVTAQVSGNPGRGLFISGDVGRGKTFLAASIANALLEQGVDTFFLIVPEFLEELRYSYQDGSEQDESELMRRAERVKVLILDDLGAHNFSEWTKNKIFTLLNYRLNYRLPCIITSNLTLDELGGVVGKRTVSRIVEMCDACSLYCDGDLRLKDGDS